MVGDLKNGRTVHALVELLSLFGSKLYFVSPESLKMPEEIISRLKEKGIEVVETTDMKEAARAADLIYMTRVQKERFGDLAEYEKVKGGYIINEGFLKDLQKKITIMHPLPRVDEISPGVDTYAGAAYFRQMRNGIYSRMALLTMIMGKAVQ